MQLTNHVTGTTICFDTIEGSRAMFAVLESIFELLEAALHQLQHLVLALCNDSQYLDV